MKKLILSLLIFCSAFASAQISIPQVTGLPAALNSKVDKVTGKSLVADTLASKIQPTAVSVTTKEPLLPSTPSNPESRFLNGNKQWAEIVLGSGGYASNVYFTNLTSTIVGTYQQTSGTHELTETIASGTCNNNEVLIYTYLFEQPVGITTVDAGVWRFTMNSKISSNVGDSKFKIVQFRRSSTGVETDMFTIYSNTIENTDYQNFIIETVQPSFLVDSLDRFGCRIYATTTTTVNKTISYKVGDGYASYLNTPLALRHPQLRDPNGNPNVQHLTAAQVTKVNNTSGINTGDETLTSIKTKLGAASSVSDGYLTYNMFNIFNSKEPSFTKNTGFNKNFGTTTGTVLEGRTFGTAANSAVGDFIQNQNSLAQSANMWINGIIKKSQPLGSMILEQGSSTWDSSISWYIDNITSNKIAQIRTDIIDGSNSTSRSSNLVFGLKKVGNALNTITDVLTFTPTLGAATFSSTVNSTGFLLNGNNLTSSLTTSYIPKWNGSTFVNAFAGADYQLPITLTTNGTSGAATFSGNVLNVPNYGSSTTGGTFGSAYTNVSNTVISVNPVAFYTNISGIFTASVKISVTSTATGKCIFRVSLPQTPYGYQSIVVQGSDSGKTTNYNMFVDNSGTNYVDIAFLASTSSSSIIVNIMAVGN